MGGCTRVPAISQISDGQIQAPTVTVQTTNTVTSTATAVVSQIADGQIQNSGVLSNGRVACQDNGTLALMLNNGSLALGGSTTFYQCRSGGFYNLYDENVASYCEPVTLNAVDLLSC